MIVSAKDNESLSVVSANLRALREVPGAGVTQITHMGKSLKIADASARKSHSKQGFQKPFREGLRDTKGQLT